MNTSVLAFLHQAACSIEQAEKALYGGTQLSGDKLSNPKCEQWIMQLAAISTAAVQNTDRTIKDRLFRSSPYWTQAYEDVCRAVDREMAERKRANEAQSALHVAQAQKQNTEEALATLKAELEQQREPLLYCRCLNHRDIAQINHTEASGGECGACIQTELGLEQAKVFDLHRCLEVLLEENAKSSREASEVGHTEGFQLWPFRLRQLVENTLSATANKNIATPKSKNE